MLLMRHPPYYEEHPMPQSPTLDALATAMPGFLPAAHARRRFRPAVLPLPALRQAAFRLIKYPLLARFAVPWQWPRAARLDAWERLGLRSGSGAKLAGLYGPAEGERRGVVVCMHPLRRDAKGYFLSSGRADLLRRNGFDVLLFDFNGFGESSCGDFNYARDVLAAAAYARERANGLPVSALGVCFGAVWTLGAAALENAFATIVLEAPLTTMQEYYARRPLAAAFFAFLWRLFPRSAANASPVVSAGNLRGSPRLLIIGGLDDTTAPPQMSRRLYDACCLPDGARRVWYVEGAAHTRAFETAPREYEARVTNFLAAAGCPTLV
jgi:alpha-beta hydrolase superfamily lysophospholipase